MYIKLVALNGRFTHSCLALFHLRTVLEEKCQSPTVEICQLTINDSYYETLLRISEGSPDVIMFSVAVWNSEKTCQLISDLRHCLPQCRLVVGGPQAEVVGETLLHGECVVVTADIEALDDQFFADLEQDRFQPLYKGSFLQLPHPTFCSPYRQTDFTGPLKNRNIYYESSRGCPYSCSYCLSSAEQGVCHKDLDQVKAELQQILTHRPKVLRFVDRTFNDNRKRSLAIWEFLLNQDAETLFHFEIAPDRFDEEMFAFLDKVPVGRFQFEIGIQSTNPQTLQAVGRVINTSVAHDNVRRLAALGTIHLHVDLILGLPYEDKESFFRSFREVFAMEAHYIQMGLLKLLPNTRITREARLHAYIASNQAPYSVLANRWLDHQTLQELYWFSEGVERFYNNRYFPSLWRYLCKYGEDPAAFFEGLLVVGRSYGLFERAATQELLTTILADFVAERKDGHLLLELLAHDWLRCGHRQLPKVLVDSLGLDDPRQLKNTLYQSLPQELPGLYGSGERNQFFKRAVFFEFSGDTVLELGCDTLGSPGTFCFLQEQEVHLHRLQKVVRITDRLVE